MTDYLPSRLFVVVCKSLILLASMGCLKVAQGWSQVIEFIDFKVVPQVRGIYKYIPPSKEKGGYSILEAFCASCTHPNILAAIIEDEKLGKVRRSLLRYQKNRWVQIVPTLNSITELRLDIQSRSSPSPVAARTLSMPRFHGPRIPHSNLGSFQSTKTVAGRLSAVA